MTEVFTVSGAEEEESSPSIPCILSVPLKLTLLGMKEDTPPAQAQTSAITANTAKTGITSAQSSAITANTAKTGITSAQSSDTQSVGSPDWGSW